VDRLLADKVLDLQSGFDLNTAVSFSRHLAHFCTQKTERQVQWKGNEQKMALPFYAPW
jgi:hypothetical protein